MSHRGECFDTKLFSRQPRSDIICGIDGGVFRDAVRSRICGHAFGMQCILKHLLKLEECPVCHVKLDVDDLEPSEVHRDYCQGLDVRCSEPHCVWQGRLGDFQSHFRSTSCGLPTVACPFCSRRILETEFEHHKDVCPEFLAICDVCMEDMPRKDLKRHKCRGKPPPGIRRAASAAPNTGAPTADTRKANDDKAARGAVGQEQAAASGRSQSARQPTTTQSNAPPLQSSKISVSTANVPKQPVEQPLRHQPSPPSSRDSSPEHAEGPEPERAPSTQRPNGRPRRREGKDEAGKRATEGTKGTKTVKATPAGGKETVDTRTNHRKTGQEQATKSDANAASNAGGSSGKVPSHALPLPESPGPCTSLTEEDSPVGVGAKQKLSVESMTIQVESGTKTTARGDDGTCTGESAGSSGWVCPFEMVGCALKGRHDLNDPDILNSHLIAACNAFASVSSHCQRLDMQVQLLTAEVTTLREERDRHGVDGSRKQRQQVKGSPAKAEEGHDVNRSGLGDGDRVVLRTVKPLPKAGESKRAAGHHSSSKQRSSSMPPSPGVGAKSGGKQRLAALDRSSMLDISNQDISMNHGRDTSGFLEDGPGGRGGPQLAPIAKKQAVKPQMDSMMAHGQEHPVAPNSKQRLW